MLKKIYLEHQNLVYSVAVSVVKDAQLAEDIVQEVFVTLYYKGNSIRDNSKIKSWLIRTTVNRAIDFTRKSQKLVTQPEDFFNQLDHNTWAEPAREMDEKEQVQEVHKAVNTLPADIKALVVLHYFLEIPQREIAETLKMPLGTVKTRLRKARMALKKHLLMKEKERNASEKGVQQDE